MKIASKVIALAAIIITALFNNKISARQSVTGLDINNHKDCLIDQFDNKYNQGYSGLKKNNSADSGRIILKEYIYVYPNPAKNVVWIKIENKSIDLEEAQVYSPFGYNIINVKLEKNLQSVDLSTYPNGIYLFIVGNRLFRIEKA